MLSFAASLLLVLALTLVAECSVAFAFGLRGPSQILAVVYVNLLTNPTANLIAAVVWSAEPSAFLPAFVVLESAVVVAEWRLLLWVLGGSSRHLLLAAALMNTASGALGTFLW